MIKNAAYRGSKASHDDLVDRVLDALRTAKAAYSLLPPLPPGVRPVHIRILSAIHRLGAGTGARVSDISAILDALLPNTTKFVNEMVELKIVRKVQDTSDKRVVLVQPTELGTKYTDSYVRHLHGRLAKAFAKVGASECAAMIATLEAIHSAMQDISVEATIDHTETDG